MRPTPCLLAAVLLGSGCLGAGSGKDLLGATSPAENVVGPLLSSTAHLVGPGADAESSIDVSADGKTILLCTHGGFTQASPLWASVDGGATFRRIDPQPNQPFDGDCDVSIGADGSWYVCYDTIASATVAASTDKGKTWTVTFLDAIPFGGVDRPWIEALGRTVYMSYQNIASGEPNINTLAVSTDGGLTWVPHVFSRAEPPERIQAIGGHPFVSEAGRTIWIPLGRSGQSGGPRFLDLAVSRDAGATWTTKQVAGPLDVLVGIPNGARAGDGTLYMAYTTARSRVGDVMVVYSTDNGGTWSKPTVVAANQTFAGLATAWIDARPDGSATLVWMKSTKFENGTTQWQPAVARIHVKDGFAADFQGLVGVPGKDTALYEFSMIRHDASGKAYIVYPLVTGPTCKETPAVPSQVGSGNIPRNNQCLYFIAENATT